MIHLLFLMTCASLYHLIDTASDFNSNVTNATLAAAIYDYNNMLCDNQKVQGFKDGFNLGASDWMRFGTIYNNACTSIDEDYCRGYHVGYQDGFNAAAAYNDSRLAQDLVNRK